MTARSTRRGFLKSAVAVGAVSTLGTGLAVADHAREQPNSVTITEDTSWLTQYRPLLDLRSVPYENRPTLYGWRVQSSDSDITTEVGVYCTEYAVQRDTLSLTSHAGDHEWIYVFVDPATGDIDSVTYSAYHWLKGGLTDPVVYEDADGTHPVFRVAPTYHNFIPKTDTEDGVLLDVNGLGDTDTESGPLYQWLANGMEDDLAPGAVHNPWLLSINGPLNDWWRREGLSRMNIFVVSAWASVGAWTGLDIRGYGEADAGDLSL